MEINRDNVTETIKATGKTLYEQVKKLLHEGNIRSIIIKNKDGKELAKFPLTFGAIGAAILPAVAVLALIIGFATDCSIIVEKDLSAKKHTPNPTEQPPGVPNKDLA